MHIKNNYFSTRGGYKVGIIHSDNGSEFNSQILHEFFESTGTKYQLTVLPFLWSKALQCAAYLINWTPKMSKKGTILYHKWFGTNSKPLTLDHLKIFGCTAYAVFPSTLRDDKLTAISIAGVTVGYAEDHKGYRIYHTETNKVFLSNQVTFGETIFPLGDSKASHKKYDFASGPLQGVPKYRVISADGNSMRIPLIVLTITPVAGSPVPTLPVNNENEPDTSSSPDQSDVEIIDYGPTDIDRLYETQENLLANQHTLAAA